MTDEDLVIACSLAAGDRQGRVKAWRDVVGAWRTGETQAPGRRDLTFRRVPELGETLRHLIALENECCPWIDFKLTEGTDELVLTMTAPEEGLAMLAQPFGMQPLGPKGRKGMRT